MFSIFFVRLVAVAGWKQLCTIEAFYKLLFTALVIRLVYKFLAVRFTYSLLNPCQNFLPIDLLAAEYGSY
jgi:hypothetical protein